MEQRRGGPLPILRRFRNGGNGGIFGLPRPLTEIVNVFKCKALKCGSERRVTLLHRPVGSSKSTIARLLKRGLERNSRCEERALFTYGWKNDDGSVLWCPCTRSPSTSCRMKAARKPACIRRTKPRRNLRANRDPVIRHEPSGRIATMDHQARSVRPLRAAKLSQSRYGNRRSCREFTDPSTDIDIATCP